MLIQLQKSLILCFVLLFIHMGSVLCIYFLPFVFWIKIIIVIFIIFYFMVVIRNHALRTSSTAVVEFWLQDNDKTWCLKRKSGKVDYGTLGFPIFISSYFIILNFKVKQKIWQISVPMAKDAIVSSDNFRRLKVFLWTMK